MRRFQENAMVIDPSFELGEYDLQIGSSMLPQETDEERFERLVEEGWELWAAVNSFMVGRDPYRALEMICREGYWKRIASTLAALFHGTDWEGLRVIQARGYDRLRGLVCTCVMALRHTGRSLPINYPRLVRRLFTSRGYAEP